MDQKGNCIIMNIVHENLSCRKNAGNKKTNQRIGRASGCAGTYYRCMVQLEEYTDTGRSDLSDWNYIYHRSGKRSAFVFAVCCVTRKTELEAGQCGNFLEENCCPRLDHPGAGRGIEYVLMNLYQYAVRESIFRDGAAGRFSVNGGCWKQRKSLRTRITGAMARKENSFSVWRSGYAKYGRGQGGRIIAEG